MHGRASSTSRSARNPGWRSTDALPSGRTASGSVSWVAFDSAAEPAIAREHNRLRPRPHTELVEQVGEVVSDRLLADPEPLGDFGVAQSAGQQGERLALAPRQRGERGSAVALRPGLPRELQDRLLESLSRGLVREQDVIA